MIYLIESIQLFGNFIWWPYCCKLKHISPKLVKRNSRYD